MNPKVIKLKAEREKNCEKIARCTARNEEIDREIMKLENTDIIGMVRAMGMSPDQLDELLHGGAPASLAGALEPEGQNGMEGHNDENE